MTVGERVDLNCAMVVFMVLRNWELDMDMGMDIDPCRAEGDLSFGLL